jgi:hypothetical protein
MWVNEFEKKCILNVGIDEEFWCYVRDEESK